MGTGAVVSVWVWQLSKRVVNVVTVGCGQGTTFSARARLVHVASRTVGPVAHTETKLIERTSLHTDEPTRLYLVAKL